MCTTNCATKLSSTFSRSLMLPPLLRALLLLLAQTYSVHCRSLSLTRAPCPVLRSQAVLLLSPALCTVHTYQPPYNAAICWNSGEPGMYCTQPTRTCSSCTTTATGLRIRVEPNAAQDLSQYCRFFHACQFSPSRLTNRFWHVGHQRSGGCSMSFLAHLWCRHDTTHCLCRCLAAHSDALILRGFGISSSHHEQRLGVPPTTEVVNVLAPPAAASAAAPCSRPARSAHAPCGCTLSS